MPAPLLLPYCAMVDFPDSWSGLNVALCHDWLTGMRGGERVLEILCNGFPDATLLTLIHNSSAVSEAINRHTVRTSALQHVPGIMKSYRYFLPFFPGAIEHMHCPAGDLLISTSHCVAKGLKTATGMKHLCYCFTPMRYAWTFQDEYFGRRSLKSTIARPILTALRNWDRAVSDRVDRFVAISRHVQTRIKRHYNRDADVVYPPVDTQRCTPGTGPIGDYDLIVSALVPYKRIDLAVRAYSRTGRRLVVVGIGTEREQLQKLAAPNIDLRGWLPDDDILVLYRACRMLIFPGEEDFGIVPLEAQACGRPVVAFARGGGLETVVDGVSGVFFQEQTEDALIDAVERCEARQWDTAAIRTHAKTFDTSNFVRGLAGSIDACLTD